MNIQFDEEENTEKTLGNEWNEKCFNVFILAEKWGQSCNKYYEKIFYPNLMNVDGISHLKFVVVVIVKLPVILISHRIEWKQRGCPQ